MSRRLCSLLALSLVAACGGNNGNGVFAPATVTGNINGTRMVAVDAVSSTYTPSGSSVTAAAIIISTEAQSCDLFTKGQARASQRFIEIGRAHV